MRCALSQYAGHWCLCEVLGGRGGSCAGPARLCSAVRPWMVTAAAPAAPSRCATSATLILDVETPRRTCARAAAPVRVKQVLNRYASACHACRNRAGQGASRYPRRLILATLTVSGSGLPSAMPATRRASLRGLRRSADPRPRFVASVAARVVLFIVLKPQPKPILTMIEWATQQASMHACGRESLGPWMGQPQFRSTQDAPLSAASYRGGHALPNVVCRELETCEW